MIMIDLIVHALPISVDDAMRCACDRAPMKTMREAHIKEPDVNISSTSSASRAYAVASKKSMGQVLPIA